MRNNIVRRRQVSRIQSKSEEATYWEGNVTIQGNGVTYIITETILSASVLKPSHTYRIVWNYPHRNGEKAGWVIQSPMGPAFSLPRNAARSGDITLTTDGSTDKDLCVIARDTYNRTTILTYQIYDLGPLSI